MHSARFDASLGVWSARAVVPFARSNVRVSPNVAIGGDRVLLLWTELHLRFEIWSAWTTTAP